MKSILALSTLIAGAALLPAGSFAADDQAQPVAQTMASADSSIASKINSQLASEHISGISVSADSSGVVSLTGSATSQAVVDKAASIAQNTAGVTAVNNNVTVASSN